MQTPSQRQGCAKNSRSYHHPLSAHSRARCRGSSVQSFWRIKIMPITLEEIRRFLGRSLQDPYGRTFGKVVGISANLKDEITGVGIEVGNGEFVQCPGDRVKISADTLVLSPTWKVEAEEFRKEFDVVTRRLEPSTNSSASETSRRTSTRTCENSTKTPLTSSSPNGNRFSTLSAREAAR